MGKEIEAIALSRGHSVPLKIDIDNAHDLNTSNLKGIDVAIEFTGPHTAFQNVMTCLRANVPVVCGSTGWLQQLPQAKDYAEQGNGALFYASNFSIGVNLFFRINQQMAKLMNGVDGYSVSQQEVHHTQKKDAPSGTAITLCEVIASELERIEGWTLMPEMMPNRIPITSVREGEVTGTHVITYDSEVDEIVLTHRAKNRRGFALGAVLAAEYSKGRRGYLCMDNLLSV